MGKVCNADASTAVFTYNVHFYDSSKYEVECNLSNNNDDDVEQY